MKKAGQSSNKGDNIEALVLQRVAKRDQVIRLSLLSDTESFVSERKYSLYSLILSHKRGLRKAVTWQGLRL